MKILRKEMKLKGYTNFELAEKLNRDPSSITAWLKGDYLPSPGATKALIELGFSEAACLEPSKDVEV